MGEAGQMTKTDRIQQLNDEFRTNLKGGQLLLTRGVVGRPDTVEIIACVMMFDKFDEGNDPYHEHDFGAFEKNGETIFWKIDYYDVNLQNGSPDPADPAVTTRVLTIMLAEEY